MPSIEAELQAAHALQALCEQPGCEDRKHPTRPKPATRIVTYARYEPGSKLDRPVIGYEERQFCGVHGSARLRRSYGPKPVDAREVDDQPFEPDDGLPVERALLRFEPFSDDAFRVVLHDHRSGSKYTPATERRFKLLRTLRDTRKLTPWR